MTDEDFALALQLQNQFFEEDDDNSQNNRFPSNEHDKPMSLVDPFWELTDPNPDMRALFLEFNAKYFWGRLAGVEVKWSSRMTLCAGLCKYEGRGGLCSISLSVPLLKLRPRKDLVETLLHEMIHAYLFVTDNNKDHDGHGPEFHKHMYRLNKETGTNITVYHNFHDEVDLYKQHWWRCNGPCQNRKPYFGYVKRSMNRAPSKNDNWWAEHQRTCGGTYTKIKEPEGYGKKKSKSEKGETKTDKDVKPGKSGVKSMDIRIFGGEGKTLGKPTSASTNKTDDQRDRLKSVPSATITSGVLSRVDTSSKSGVQNKEKKGTNTEGNNKTRPKYTESNPLPGSSTPTKGVKNRPVSQGGNIPFNKVKKKSIPVLDFSSDSDDDLLAAANQVDAITSQVKDEINTSGLSDSVNSDRVCDKQENPSRDSQEDVDPSDVRSMLRKVWGQKQIVQNKKPQLSLSSNVSDNVLAHHGKKRPSLDADSNSGIKRIKVNDNNEKSPNKASGSGLNSSIRNSNQSSVLSSSDKTNNEQTSSNSKTNSVKVTSPIEKMFNKIKDKQTNSDTATKSISGAASKSVSGTISKSVSGVTSNFVSDVTSKSLSGASTKSVSGTKSISGAAPDIDLQPDADSMSGKDTMINKGTKATVIDNCVTDCDESSPVITSDEVSLCPVCNKHVPVSTINDHLDLCLTLKAISS